MDENNQQQTEQNATILLTPQSSKQTQLHILKKIFIIFGIVIIAVIGIMLSTIAIRKNESISQQKIPAKPTQPPPPPSINSTPIITIGPIVSTATWKTFTDPNYGYSFYYPVDWQVQGFPQKGTATLPLGSPSENTYYGSSFMIPNTVSSKDSAIQVSINLYNNNQNLPLNQWVLTHPESYASIQKNHRDQQIVINGYQSIKVTITPDINVWNSTLAPFDETFYINSITINKNIVLAISINGNGEGSSKLYTVNDPFVKKELPIFETFVSSFTFLPPNDFFSSILSQNDINDIKQSIAQQDKQDLNQLRITIDPVTNQYNGLFAAGQVGPANGGGGAIWYAAKVHGKWITVAITQAPLLCNSVNTYNLPTSLVSTCLDSNNNLITR